MPKFSTFYPKQMKIEQYKKIFGTHVMVNWRGKNLTNEDALVIGELLKTNNTLKWLRLENNNITDVESIGDALKTNNTLKILEVRKNNITDVQSIGEGLKTNNTLTQLYLENNNITDDSGIQSIIDVLKTNNTLWYLSLRSNQLSSNMISQLNDIMYYKRHECYEHVEDMVINAFYSNKIKLRF